MFQFYDMKNLVIFSPKILGKLVELIVQKTLILVKKNKICGNMVGI